MTGAIQSAGCLIALDEDWCIQDFTTNSAALLGLTEVDSRGTSLCTCMSGDAVHTLRNLVTMVRTPKAAVRGYRLPLFDDERLFDARIHRSGERILCEFFPAAHEDHADHGDMVRDLIGQLDTVEGPNALAQMASRHLRALTAFDHVTVFGNAFAPATTSRETAPVSLEHWPMDPATRVIVDYEADNIETDIDVSATVLHAPTTQERAFLTDSGMRAAFALHAPGTKVSQASILCLHRHPRMLSLKRQAMVELYARMLGLRLEIEAQSLSSE